MMQVLNVIACVIFAGALNTRAADPVIPQIAIDFGIEAATGALLSTAFAVPYALMQPVLGAMADTFGKVRMMTGCIALIIVTAIAGAMATDFTVLLVTRAVSGVAAGGLFPIGLAIAGDLVAVEKRQVAIGRLLMATMTGNILGAAAAGAVGDLVGWRGVFLSVALIGAISIAVLLVALRGRVKNVPVPFTFSGQIANIRKIFANPLAKVCFGAVFLEGTFLFGTFPHLAGLLYAGGETRASIAGIVLAGFGVGGLTYTFVVALIVRQAPERRLMFLGGLFMGVGVALIALRVPWQMEFAVFVMIGFAFYLLHGPIQVYVTELAPEARGMAASLHAACFFLGQAAGPVLYKYSFAHFGTNASLLAGGGVIVLTGIWCSLTLRRRATP
jgi:predicted MFS family arabinose efflux permease